MSDKLPSLSIVTPSYNQAGFLSETIQSVLGQGYPDLEYAVVDGGSTDRSREIIESHADRLVYWTSEKDKGTYDAINKGFAKTSGEIMAWINSDDKYAPWAFSVVGEIFRAFPEIEWLTSGFPMHWDARGRAVHCYVVPGFSRGSFLKGSNLPTGRFHIGPWIQQETTFWRRSLWERAGGKLEIGSVAGDFELWARFFSQGASLHTVGVPLGGFRTHGDQISVKRYQEYLDACEDILQRYGGGPPSQPLSLLRFCLHHAFSGAPLDKLPSAVSRALQALGLAHPAPCVRWSKDGWTSKSTFIF